MVWMMWISFRQWTKWIFSHYWPKSLTIGWVLYGSLLRFWAQPLWCSYCASRQSVFASLKNSAQNWAERSRFFHFSWIWMRHEKQQSGRRSVHRKLFGVSWSNTHELFWNWRNFKFSVDSYSRNFRSKYYCNFSGKSKVFDYGKLKESDQGPNYKKILRLSYESFS